jgi:hypothetical protein
MSGPPACFRWYWFSQLRRGSAHRLHRTQCGHPGRSAFDGPNGVDRSFDATLTWVLPLNLAIRRPSGGTSVEAFPQIGYYDRQLARARDIVASGDGELAAAIERTTLMAAIHRQAREAQ